MTYEDALKSAVTTFVLPENVVSGELVPVDMEALQHLPYHSIRIVEPFCITPDSAERIARRMGVADVKIKQETRKGIDRTVFYLDGDRVRYAGKISTDLGTTMRYDDGGGVDPGSIGGFDWPIHSQGKNTSALIILRRLLSFLNDRSTRYQEQPPVNRQQRRAEGLPKEHRTYLVVRPRDEAYKIATRSGEIMKRLRALHTVRGHMRHLSSGRIVPVRAHTRGKLGTAVQAKDYVIS